MGKVKKTPIKDEKQKKISSFFQQGNSTSKPATSNLFTTLGNKPTTVSKLSLKRNKSTESLKSNQTDKIDAASRKCVQSSSVKSNVGLPKRTEGEGDIPHKEPTVIPETQLFKSPALCKQGDERNDSISDCEEIMIPDTPEDSKVEPKGKKGFGRSFLTSTAAVGKKPGLTKAEIIQKKHLSRARKSLVSISLSSHMNGNITEKEIDKNLEKVEGNGCHEILSDVTVEVDHRDSGIGLKESFDNTRLLMENESQVFGQTKIGKSSESMQDQGLVEKENIESDAENICDSSLITMDAETPTKLYETSIKRMSKTGESPEYKRITAEDDFKDSSDVIIDKNRVKRNLCNVKPSEKRKKIKPKVSAVNNYQLTMSTHRKNESESDVTTADDDVLGELLGELDAKTNAEPLTFVDENTPLTTLKLKNRKSLSKKKSPLLIKNAEVSKEEQMLFQTLDEEVHAEFQTTKEVSASVQHSETCAPKSPTPRTAVSMKLKSSQNSIQVERFQDTYKESMDIELVGTPEDSEKLTTATQNIKEFASQIPKAPPMVDDIEEFQSQMDDSLCEGLDALSPFKTNVKVNKTIDAETELPICTKYGRHTVVKKEHVNHEVVLNVKTYDTEEMRTCVLCGFWSDTHVEEGDTIHILGTFDSNGICRITDKEGFIIVNPDLLLSGTTVVSSIFCMRKSILNDKFKGCDRGNIQMLYGSIIHSVFQEVLRKQMYEENQITAEAENTMKQSKFIHEMYGNGVTDLQVMEEIKKYIPPLQSWLLKHTQYTQSMIGAQSKTSGNITVSSVRDIEENIWSPRFGVKGKIDLTVDVKLNKNHRATVPLELKTGRASFSMEHKGQVTLYSMMSSDRRQDPKQGLLLYLKEPVMKMIEVDHVNKRGIINLRNEMAYYLSRQVQRVDCEDGHVTYSLGRLPEPINNPRACTKCPQLLNCALYQKNVENRALSNNHAMQKLVPETLAHLSPSHMEYFIHWCLLLDLENKANQKSGGLKEIWCKTGPEREKKGDCLSHLTVLPEKTKNSEDKDVVFIHFHRKMGLSSPSLNMVGILKHDYVIVSAETSELVAVCAGSITNISEEEVVLLTEREGLQRLTTLKSHLFRLDRYDSYNTSAIFYSNLSRLLYDEPVSCRLRELFIENKKPEFILKMSKGEIEKVKDVFKPLNKPQKTAILKVLMCKDYVLIKGYPGTGKTSTIVALVKVLTLLGHSVLLTSYTHSAVDNILIKLLKERVKFVRLGRTSKIHPTVQPYGAEKLTENISNVADLREFYSSQRVVATTALGMNHSVFTQRRFDVCIMDEASQILQPVSLGPLFYADRFVLVGDSKQLPPVVQSKEARDLGMDESLFVRLQNGSATFELNLQYRMNRDIMYLSNTLVYNGCLKCGNDSVAFNRLKWSKSSLVNEVFEEYSWMSEVLSDEPYKAALFLDTDKVPAQEERDSTGLIKNVIEARIVTCLVESFVKIGVKESNIGVIAPYRKQVTLIRDLLTCKQEVEVNTVDQYQGRDKDIIIISLTRSFSSPTDAETKSGELLKDIRRLNVALTRAKKMLILVGHVNSLKSYPPLESVIKLLQDKDCILALPQDAHLSFRK
ncbi:DNA replication ATP-dependent helicase/nuclease DNA2-like [Saccostrea echinata]|uniref:DNA replication ATP-dependent helicase/nuclease DNA2-like n=1 Tax=Saccostrea echinata TaxID=191078 RepID=UPI002A81E105|nr:DNA replication ATP-dependent helicase/nuclease DNA2-like [Saccostrea echinata]